MRGGGSVGARRSIDPIGGGCIACSRQLKGGGCGVRYFSPVCQAQGWRDGHRLSCGRLQGERGRHMRA